MVHTPTILPFSLWNNILNRITIHPCRNLRQPAPQQVCDTPHWRPRPIWRKRPIWRLPQLYKKNFAWFSVYLYLCNACQSLVFYHWLCHEYIFVAFLCDELLSDPLSSNLHVKIFSMYYCDHCRLKSDATRQVEFIGYDLF